MNPLVPASVHRVFHRPLGSLRGAASGYAIARGTIRPTRLCSVVTADVQAAARLTDEICFFLDDPTLRPCWASPIGETLPYDVFSPLPD